MNALVWRLRLLGDLTLERDGVEFRRLRAQKYAHLLAYLALHSTRAHGREELIEIFWPDEPIDKARTCLRTALSSLRRQLNSPTLFLHGSRDSIRLNPQVISTDVHAFEKAVLKGDPQARQLYTGPLLSGCYYEWALDERFRLEALFEGAPDTVAAPILTVEPESPDLVRRRLPAPLTHFFGRDDEIEQIRRLFDEDGLRLITLLGMGGIGKTRLAIKAGQVVAADFVTFVALSEQTHLNGMRTQIVDSIGLSLTPADTLESRLEADLSSRNSVLILDNFEQLVDDETTVWLQGVLTRIPSLKVLTTSRLPLGIEGEYCLPMRPLSQGAAMALFIDRARHVLPDFADSPVLPKLCDSLDRVPLAVELCASWANVLSAPRMLSGLSKRFELMQSRKRMISDRHQNLHAVLEWSCPADSELRPDLGILSVLRGTWSIEAAEALLGGQAVKTVSKLAERSLLQSEVANGAVRFHQLESVRDFALAGLDPKLLGEARRNHNRFFCELASYEAARHQDDPLTAFRSLSIEHSNVYSAFSFGLEGDAEILESTLRSLFRVKWCWWVRGYVADLEALYERAASRSSEGFSGLLQGLIFSACAPSP